MNNGKFFAGLALGALVGSALSCFAPSNSGKDESTGRSCKRQIERSYQ